MNRPITRVYGVVVVLFALLIAFTSRWTVFEASSLRNNSLNVRGLLEQERIQRGAILAADGTVLARSVSSGKGSSSASTRRRSVRVPSATPSPTSGRPVSRATATVVLSGPETSDLQAVLDQLQGKRRPATK